MVNWWVVLAVVLVVVLAIVAAAVYAFVKAFFKYGGEFRKSKSGFVITFFPWFLYSAFSAIAGVFNILLNDIIPYRYGLTPTLWSDAAHSPELTKSVGEKRVAEIKTQILDNYPASYKEEELVQLFDSLEPATENDMVGKTFKNKIVDVEELAMDNWYEWVAKMLAKVGVHLHRRFFNKFEGDSVLLSILELLILPLPIFGNVAIKELSFRGKVNATMVYDHQPWNDYIRVLDNGAETNKKVYLVFSTMRDQGNGFYTLTYRPEVETL